MGGKVISIIFQLKPTKQVEFHGCHRVNGNLAMSRAVGDFRCFCSCQIIIIRISMLYKISLKPFVNSHIDHVATSSVPASSSLPPNHRQFVLLATVSSFIILFIHFRSFNVGWCRMDCGMWLSLSTCHPSFSLGSFLKPPPTSMSRNSTIPKATTTPMTSTPLQNTCVTLLSMLNRSITSQLSLQRSKKRNEKFVKNQ